MFEDRIISGRYQIIEQIGIGGSGIIYRGRHLKLDIDIAIKCLGKGSFHFGILRREVEILKKLSHVGLPRIYDIEEDEEYCYMIQEFIEGETLTKRIENDGSLKPSFIVEILKQLLSVLRYLHGQSEIPIIHRDIKPDNIMLTDKGVIKLIDFGIAREYKLSSMGDTVYLGTKGYAAPEQFGVGQSDARTDIYALGMTISVMLKGTLSHDSSVLDFIDSDLGVEERRIALRLEKVVGKAIQFVPEDRYQTVRELQEALFSPSHKETQLLNSRNAKFEVKQTNFEPTNLEYEITHNLKRTIIGIQGSKAGVGVTHLCLMMAFSLKKLGYRVTIAYEPYQKEYENIFQYYEGDPKAQLPMDKSFLMDGVAFKQYQGQQGLGQIMTNHTDFYIVDCGSKLRNHPEWIRAHIRMAVYTSALWQMPINKSFFDLYASYSDTIHLLSPSDNKLTDALMRECDWRPKRYYHIPFHGNPFKMGEGSAGFIEKVLGLKKRGRFRIPFTKGV